MDHVHISNMYYSLFPSVLHANNSRPQILRSGYASSMGKEIITEKASNFDYFSQPSRIGGSE